MLGPGYAVGIAFGSSLLRNLLGWGTLLAFPGSMFGALLAGLFYRGVSEKTPGFNQRMNHVSNGPH